MILGVTGRADLQGWTYLHDPTRRLTLDSSFLMTDKWFISARRVWFSKMDHIMDTRNNLRSHMLFFAEDWEKRRYLIIVLKNIG